MPLPQTLPSGRMTYWQVRSAWHIPPAPQSASTKHSTQAWVATSQAGSPLGQSAAFVHMSPQVWPLEQDGVAIGQSLLVRQSTQVWLGTSQT